MVRTASLTALWLLAWLAPAAHAQRGELAGATTIQGSVAGYVPVTLERDLVLELSGSHPNTSATSVGQAGLLLRKEGKGEAVPGLAGLTAQKDGKLELTPLTSTAGHEYRLPRGDYRLYLLRGKDDGRATLRLPALEGSRTFTPLFSTPIISESLPRMDAGATNHAVFGATHDLGSEGMISSLVGVTAGDPAYQRVELCTYQPGTNAAASGAFGPGCPEGESRVFDGRVEPSGTSVLFPAPIVASQTRFGVPPGSWGLGGNVTAAAAGMEAFAAGVWMSFDGTPIPGAQLPDPAASPTTTAPAGWVRLSGARAGNARRARVTVTCLDRLPCEGQLRAGKGAATMFRVMAGTRSTVVVKLPRPTQRQLKRRRVARIRFVATGRGEGRTAALTARLRPR